MLNRATTVAAIAIGGALLIKKFTHKSATGSDYASSVLETIEVEVPVSTAYNQWTQFEEFPRFMKSVQEIRQLDDKHLSWHAIVGGKPKQWDVEITEQVPDMRIAWCSTSGARNAGVVSFHKITDTRTRIVLQMDYKPEGVVEHVGDVLGAVKLEARANLKNFKELLEKRGHETGAWRGTVPQH